MKILIEESVLRQALEFWENYSTINEAMQDKIVDEKDAQLDALRSALDAAEKVNPLDLWQIYREMKGIPHPAPAVPEKKTPFSNCKYQICDLPGQCVSEGKCHHPAPPKLGADKTAREPSRYDPTGLRK